MANLDIAPSVLPELADAHRDTMRTIVRGLALRADAALNPPAGHNVTTRFEHVEHECEDLALHLEDTIRNLRAVGASAGRAREALAALLPAEAEEAGDAV